MGEVGSRQDFKLHSAIREVFIFLFDSFGQPLFHHRLVVEVAGAGEAFDAGEHAGVEAQGDGGGFAGVRFVGGAHHKFGVDFVILPISGFFSLVFKRGDVCPGCDGVHRDVKGWVVVGGAYLIAR